MKTQGLNYFQLFSILILRFANEGFRDLLFESQFKLDYAGLQLKLQECFPFLIVLL